MTVLLYDPAGNALISAVKDRKSALFGLDTLRAAGYNDFRAV